MATIRYKAEMLGDNGPTAIVEREVPLPASLERKIARNKHLKGDAVQQEITGIVLAHLASRGNGLVIHADVKTDE